MRLITALIIFPGAAFAHGLHTVPESGHTHLAEIALFGLVAAALTLFLRRSR